MIALGCDHGGFNLISAIKKHFDEQGIAYKDFGTYSEDSVDYPVYACKVANAVVSGECELGILCCGTGIGMSIAANKVKGIRAAVCSEPMTARLCREHNNANIIAFGARIIGIATAEAICDAFLSAQFAGGDRHERRVGLITEIENKR
mgnify:CR=1 FL=1